MKLKYFELAQKVSYKSPVKQHRLGCVIVKGNKVISVGFNSEKTHPKSNSRFRTLHAEVAAVLGCSYQELAGASAYIYRVRKDGTLGCSKPCPSCTAALTESGIKRVYHTDYDGYKELQLS